MNFFSPEQFLSIPMAFQIVFGSTKLHRFERIRRTDYRQSMSLKLDEKIRIDRVC